VVCRKTAASWIGRLPVSPAVLWAGIAVGVFLAAEAMVHGVVLPLALGVIADAALTFLLIVAAAVVLAELTHRHHRTVLGHGGRLPAPGARRVQLHGGGVLAWLPAKAGSWRASREHQPLLFRRLGKPELVTEGTEGQEDGPPEPHHLNPEAPKWHRAWGTPPGDGPDLNGKPSPSQEGNTTMPPSKISTGHRAQRAARTGAPGIPSEWASVVGQTADFEPESDAELLDWMARQVTGLSAWAEALVDTYEHCTSVIGIDPQASAMLHDVADAAAQAAETMGAAKAKFTEHYELPREFAANGGLMTHDGRWITGEGA
jgi:hypothetical protein